MLMSLELTTLIFLCAMKLNIISGQQDYGGYLSILGDSAKDLVADAKGIYKGYNNPTGDCYDMMKSYYNPYKK